MVALVFSFTSIAYGQDTVTYNKVVTDSFEYEFSPGDSWLLVQPAVCYITSAYFCYVFDTIANQWSDMYVYGPFGGTGFVVNPETGTIVTAGHVVDDVVANYVNLKWAILDEYIFDNYPDDYFNLTNDEWDFIYDNFKVEGLNRTEPEREVWVQFNTAAGNVPDNPGDTFTRAEVISLSDRDQRDIAVLKITPITGRALSSAIVGDSSMVDIGSPLTIIGYPWTSDIGQGNTLTPTVTQGTVSGRVMYRGTSVLQVQGDARPGNSGGPVISGQDGTIIGILTMGTDNTNLYLRPANDVKALIGVENKLGQVDTEWRIGLAMYRQNHFSEALKHFDAVLNLSSGHLGAQEYKAKAQANMGSDVPLTQAPAETVSQETLAIETTVAAESIKTDSAREQGNIPVWVWVIIGVFGGLIVIAVAVLVIVMVKKKGPQMQTAAPQQQAGPQEIKSGTKFCATCGKPVEEGAAFCPSCGNKQ